MGLIDLVRSAFAPATPTRSQWPESTDYHDLFSFAGNQYFVPAIQQTLYGKVEEIRRDYVGVAEGAYYSNSVVWACMLARRQLFSEARFQYQRMNGGRPSDLWGDGSLQVLEHPWPNGVTGDLLARMIDDADLAGNAFVVRRGNVLRRLRPDWVTIVLGSYSDPSVEAGDIDAEVLGYAYHKGGLGAGNTGVFLQRSEVAHFAPHPDPLALFRGMSWLTPVIREIQADSAMTNHRQLFFENGATPNMVVSLDKDIGLAAFKEWKAQFAKDEPKGWDAYKTLYLGAGADAKVVGADLQQIDFKAVQGAGETRIAAAAGVPPVIVGLSEGLQAATYSNYGQARRRFADNTMRPLWRNVAGSLETIVRPPPGNRLWYDDRDIQALAEDKKDLAEVRTLESQQIRTLLDAGFDAKSVTACVASGDFSKLVHTGLFSVQLQAPGSTKMPTGEVPGDLPVGGGTKPETTPAAPTKPPIGGAAA